MKKQDMPKYPVLFTLLIVVLTSCGPRAATEVSGPTVTPFPTFGYVQPTEAPAVVAAGAGTATANRESTLDPDRVALGKNRYEALECGSCHGDKGQGTDKGSILAGMKLSEDEFINALRTGGKLGNDHLYSTNRLSDAGTRNLYLYILSLGAGIP